MLLFAASIFLSAFLLFQIQPMIAKVILPWFGGAPAVWSAAMLFFQLILLGGYSYANWLVRQKKQMTIHGVLLGIAFLAIAAHSFGWGSPILPESTWKPINPRLPVLEIFKVLGVSVGVPYFVLSSNGPLMQAWFARAFPSHSYARLYALSNAGSLIGLIAYPVVFEPALSLGWQGWVWGGSFLLFGLLVVGAGIKNKAVALPLTVTPDANHKADSPSDAMKWLWLGLSTTASIFLLSVTNQISQEVAVIPFLWIVPLTIYLLSFIVAFSSGRDYGRKPYSVLFAFSLAATLFVMLHVTGLHIVWQILAYSLLLFVVCMICHGELYLLRPSAEHLTVFYFVISLGGVLGGVFVSLIAPLIFNGYWELFVALAMAISIVLTMFRQGSTAESRSRFVFIIFLLVTTTLAIISFTFQGGVFSKRNFYGVIRVQELPIGESNQPAFVMSHGVTVHGLQFIDAGLRNTPTTYYVPESGAGLAILNHPNYGKRMRVGLLGVGAGTLAAYGQPDDEYSLYEINPVVVDLAEGQGGYFSFVPGSHANVKMVAGDARISLERELSQGLTQNFDVLVLDTFSSDSIPVHLVTKEAFELYLAHLAPDGIIAAHITNLHLDLQPVFWKLAQEFRLHMIRIDYPGDQNGGYASHWILLARDSSLLDLPVFQEHSVDLTGYSTSLKLWTDDYSNLLQILK